MLVGFVETKNFYIFFRKKIYINYLAGYPAYNFAGYLAKSVSGTTLYTDMIHHYQAMPI